jgi:hypothetical protein
LHNLINSDSHRISVTSISIGTYNHERISFLWVPVLPNVAKCLASTCPLEQVTVESQTVSHDKHYRSEPAETTFPTAAGRQPFYTETTPLSFQNSVWNKFTIRGIDCSFVRFIL